jgi:hypothetical protein
MELLKTGAEQLHPSEVVVKYLACLGKLSESQTRARLGLNCVYSLWNPNSLSNREPSDGV